MILLPLPLPPFLLLQLVAWGTRETLHFTSVFKLRQSVGLLGREISPSQGRNLTQTQNNHRP
jgi:hypothetical protein